MIRLLFHSENCKLQQLLAPTLGPEFQVLVEPDRQRLKQRITDGECDVLVLDFDSVHCSIAHQLEVVDEYRHSHIPIVVMTDDDRRSTALEMVHHGVYDFFRKPPSIPELKITVRRAHEHAVLKREFDRTQERLRAPQARVSSSCDQLVGSSPRSRVVYDLISRVTNLNAFVLITGESGTGKELIGRAIHNLSNRSTEPFVAVSCGAIPETLIEAELFGHEKGAFTGADRSRSGYLEQAAGGTLFLDEIGELSLRTQVKLLRVLQQREFSRLGSSRSIPLRAHVVFATHRDLVQMVAQGTFRQDFYYRVNVMKIHSPALRDRTEDIPDLAQHFLQQYSAMYDKPVRSFDPAAMASLIEYAWPGNVRELENAVQSAIIVTDRDTIGVEDLPETLQQLDPHLSCLDDDETVGGGSFDEQLRDYRVKLAVKAIDDASGNKTVAARSLNISRAYLHRLIREAGEEVAVV
jgi:DNA-binding NtrC family response regulator